MSTKIKDFRKKLKKIYRKLWKRRRDPGNDRFWWSSDGKLTVKEWIEVKKIIKDNDLIVEMTSGEFGFGIGIAIFETSIAPGLNSEFLMGITDKQLPWEKELRDHSLAEREFKPLTHNSRNRQLLQDFGFDPPHENIARYDY